MTGRECRRKAGLAAREVVSGGGAEVCAGAAWVEGVVEARPKGLWVLKSMSLASLTFKGASVGRGAPWGGVLLGATRRVLVWLVLLLAALPAGSWMACACVWRGAVRAGTAVPEGGGGSGWTGGGGWPCAAAAPAAADAGVTPKRAGGGACVAETAGGGSG